MRLMSVSLLVVMLLPATSVPGATPRDVRFGAAVELSAPVNGSGGTGNGFYENPQDRHPTLTRDGLALVWQSLLVKNPDWSVDPDNAWYIVQSTRLAWDQPWSAPMEIISSTAADGPQWDMMPSVSRDGLRLLYNDDLSSAAAGTWREPFRLASRADRGSQFDFAEVVDIVDTRFQGVIDEFETEIYMDQYRCARVGSPQQRWHVYPQDGFLGPCGNFVYFLAEDIWPSLDWQFLADPPPPWPAPGRFNSYNGEGYEFRCEPLTFAPGDLDGQDGWSVLSGEASVVNRSRNALEVNQYFAFPASSSGDDPLFQEPVLLPFPPNEATGAFDIHTDAEPSLSAGRLTLYWNQFDYRGGANFYDQDIVTTARASVVDPWNGPAHVEVGNVNDTSQSSDEIAPSISQDGLEMYFVRGNRLHVSTRIDTGSSFGLPAALIFDGSYDEAAYTEATPEISADGQHLYFASNKVTLNGMTAMNLFMATRGVSALHWGNVVDLGNGVSWWPGLPNQYGGDELSPTVTDDELAIVFSADRLDGGWYGLFIATRNSSGEEFGNRTLLTELNAEGVSNRGAELGYGYTRDDVLNGLAEIYFHRSADTNDAAADLYYAAPYVSEIPPDNIALLETGNTMTGEGAAFVSRFAIRGTEPTSSAIIELGYDDGGTQHVFARFEVNSAVGGELSAVDGDGAGGGTDTQIDLIEVSEGGGTCTTFPTSYQADQWYLVEITATASSTSPTYDVTIRDPFRAGPLVLGTCNFPDPSFVPIGEITGMGAIDGAAGTGPLNFVRITGNGVWVDAGPTCSELRSMTGWVFAGLMQVEAEAQPPELTTLPLYGELRSLRLKYIDPALTPSQQGPVRTNNRLSSPYVTDDNLTVYFSSTGYWNNGQYAPPDGYGEEDGYYGFDEPVLWRGHRDAVRDQSVPANQAVRVGDAEPIFCPGVFDLGSTSRRLLDPELGPDGLYFVTSDVLGGVDGEMKIWVAPFFGDLDGDGDVDGADQSDFDARMGGPYDAAIDYDLDGNNDAADQAAFDHNLGFQAGDLDGDGDVDYDDFLIMDGACDQTICSQDWNQAADLNRDLVINDDDLAEFALSYGLGVPGGAGSLPELPAALPSCAPCPDPFADVDSDGDVDQDDFRMLQLCYTGVGDPDSVFDMQQCRCLDRDHDDDIDQDDLDAFELCASGPDVPADDMCDD